MDTMDRNMSGLRVQSFPGKNEDLLARQYSCHLQSNCMHGNKQSVFIGQALWF